MHLEQCVYNGDDLFSQSVLFSSTFNAHTALYWEVQGEEDATYFGGQKMHHTSDVNKQHIKHV